LERNEKPKGKEERSVEIIEREDEKQVRKC